MARTPDGTLEGLGSNPAQDKSLNQDPPTHKGLVDRGKDIEKEMDKHGPPSLQFFLFLSNLF